MIQTTTTLCHDCGALLTDGTNLCLRCRDDLAHDIAASSDVLRELDVTLSRLDKVTPLTAGGKSATTPMPYSVEASNAATELRATRRALCRSGFTHANVRSFRAAKTEAWRVVDIPDPRTFLGTCSCGRGVYAREGDSAVTCGCGETWDVVALDARTEIRKMVGSVAALRTWLMHLGIVRSRAQLYRDVARLKPVNDDPRTYSLAELYQSLLSMEGRRVHKGA